MPADAWIDALLSREGQELLAALGAETLSPDAELRVLTRYRARYPADLVSIAFAQVKLRARARAKFSRADHMYFTVPGLEQASTERMAQHHALRFAGFAQVADLCSGIGGDLLGLAHERRVIAVDIDPVHSRLGVLNADAYGVAANVMPVCEDVRAVDYHRVRAAFIDPARRGAQGRMRSGESEPSLDWCFELATRGLAVGIKAAPALPVDVVPADWEIEFVSEHRELKEAVLWSPSLATARRRATLVGDGERTLIAADDASLTVRAPGAYIIDPDPAVTRAGLVETLGAGLGDAWKIDARVAFLSSDRQLQTPFGRTLRIESSMPWSLARLRESLRSLDVGTVDIRKRGSAVDVDEIQRRLKLTGSRSATVVLTRVANAPWAMVCSEPGLT